MTEPKRFAFDSLVTAEQQKSMNRSQAVESTRLEDAFEVFNRFSDQLTTSYQALEQRVERLNGELQSAHDGRLEELAEKERLASRLSGLLAALPAGVVVLDAAGVVQEANPAAQDLLGEPLLGVAWRDLIQRAFAPDDTSANALLLRDGRRVTVSTCPLGEEPGQILLLQDVTESTALQQRLQRHERLSAMGEMAAKLAHQIRTPLAAAILYVSHLGQPYLDSTKQAEVSQKILARLRTLETMVRDMLIYARGGSPGSEQIPVDGLLLEVEQSVAPLLPVHDFSLSLESSLGDVCVLGNREALLGAMQNLVVNAVQACGQRGRLQLVAADNEDGTVRLGLCDDGPGVDTDAQQKLFEPFFTTRSQGIGLGLAVVQAVALAHDGSVWVDSSPDQGCCIGMRLPVITTTVNDGASGNDATEKNTKNTVGEMHEQK